MSWLIDETTEATTDELEAESTSSLQLRASQPNLAIRLNDVVIHKVQKWFGDAAIRVDTIIVDGGDQGDEHRSIYQPTTRRFPEVRDGERLPIEEPGLLVFYGRPRNFLDISIMASRDRKDSEDLSAVLDDLASSQGWSRATELVGALGVAAPPAAAIGLALQAAPTLASFAMKTLADITGATVGVYHTSFLQRRDRFGVGRHPSTGAFLQDDFAFWYDIVVDKPDDSARVM